MGDVSETGYNSLLGLLPFAFVPHFPSASLFSSSHNHGPCSATSPLPKEKSKWEEKQKSLESELMELHETVASLQSRLRRAELQGMEAQVRGPGLGEGVPQAPGSSSQAHFGLWSFPIHMQCPASFSSVYFSGCSHMPEGHYQGPSESSFSYFSELRLKFLPLALKAQSLGWLICTRLSPLGMVEPWDTVRDVLSLA